MEYTLRGLSTSGHTTAFDELSRAPLYAGDWGKATPMTHETDEYDRPEYAPMRRSRRRSSGGAKLALAIGAMAGEIAWLGDHSPA